MGLRLSMAGELRAGVLQPCMLFAGSVFESSPAHRLAKSVLLDTFRGRVVDSIDLKARLHSVCACALTSRLLCSSAQQAACCLQYRAVCHECMPLATSLCCKRHPA